MVVFSNTSLLCIDPPNFIVFIRANQPCDNNFDHVTFYCGWQKTYPAILWPVSQANIYRKQYLAQGFDSDTKHRSWTLIYNIFLAKKKISFYLFFDGCPLWCFGLMTAVSISDVFVICVIAQFLIDQ